MRAYRRIGGHSWSQPKMELLHKQGRGMPLTLITEEMGTWGKSRGMWQERRVKQRKIHMSCTPVSWQDELEGETGTKIRAKIKRLSCFSVQQCQHEVTSLLCKPQGCRSLRPSSIPPLCLFFSYLFYLCSSCFIASFHIFIQPLLTFYFLRILVTLLLHPALSCSLCHKIRYHTVVTQHRETHRFFN